MSIRIGISLGDPSGVGPETVAKAILSLETPEVEYLLFCDKKLFSSSANRFRWAAELLALDGCGLEFYGSPEFPGPAKRFCPTPEGGAFAYRSLTDGIDKALGGKIDALITAPLSKSSLNLAGYYYPGNTEILKEKSSVPRVVMMLLAGDFRVIPLTRHVALKDVPGLITEPLIVDSARIVSNSMATYEGLGYPRIGVLALNPHGGEDGLFGSEEEVISSAINKLSSEGYNIEGPLVPDTTFVPRYRNRYDVIIGMYHDQVLIPLKMTGFERGVNVTLGLPFIRTSPDHGTAFDIAGTDSADPSSTIEAIRLAIKWAQAIS